MKMICIGACALVATTASTASALQYIGTISGNEGTASIGLSEFPDSTNYEFSFSTAAPILSGIATYQYESAFDQYFDGSSTPYGGDNFPVDETLALRSSNSKTLFHTPAQFFLYYPDGNVMEHDYFYSDFVNVDFYTAPKYSGTPFELSITPVPEPASWSFMVLGLGGLGLTLRRGRRNTWIGKVAATTWLL